MSLPFGSTNRLSATKTAAKNFLNNVSISVTRPGTVIAFDQRGKIYQAYTVDLSSLLSATDSIQIDQGGTDYWWALTTTYDQIKTSPAYKNSITPPVIIMLSDGMPHEEGGDAVALANTMKADGIVIYTIGIVDGSWDTTELQRLAGSNFGAGYYVPVSDVTQLQAAYNQIASKVNCAP
jgi:uncharacterized protein YegL